MAEVHGLEVRGPHECGTLHSTGAFVGYLFYLFYLE